MAWTENIGSHYPSTWTNDSKVKFLHGTQANLNSYIEVGAAHYGQAEEGAFYLTTDTHRLYVGRLMAANTVVPMPVNEGVTKVDLAEQDPAQPSKTFLPNTANVGDFYYIEEGNILAVCSSVATRNGERKCSWLQLNNDTSLSATTFDVDTETVSNATNVIITSSVTDTGNHSVSDMFKLREGANISLSVTGSGTTNDKFVVTIDAVDTQYDLAATADTANNGADITLTSNDATPVVDTVALRGYKAGTEIVDKVTVSSNDITIESEVPTSFTATTAAGQDGWDLTLKRGLLSSNDRNTDITVGSTQTIDPVIRYGVTSGTGIDAAHTYNSVHFINGTATMSDIYTAAQTDDRINYEIANALQSNNAMHFMGVVTQASDLSASTHDFHLGDVYRVVTNTIISSNAIATEYNSTPLRYVKADPQSSIPYVENGDLLIAVGTEDATGVITSATLQFIPIPSGDEKTYSLDLTSGNAASSYNDTTGSAAFMIKEGSSAFLDFSLTGDSTQKKILVSGVANSGSKSVTATLQHAKVSVTNGTAVAETLPAASTFTSSVHSRSKQFSYTAYTFDDTGHVESATVHNVTMEDSHNYVTEVNSAFNINSTSGNAELTLEVVDADGNSADNTISYASDTITFSSSDTSATTAGTVNMEIMWGSF